jgi:hypothetical protein
MNQDDNDVIFKDSEKDKQLYSSLEFVCVKQYFESQCFLITVI